MQQQLVCAVHVFNLEKTGGKKRKRDKIKIVAICSLLSIEPTTCSLLSRHTSLKILVSRNLQPDKQAVK